MLTPFSVKFKSLFVLIILDVLEIALNQSEALLHRRHVRMFHMPVSSDYKSLVGDCYSPVDDHKLKMQPLCVP